MRPVLRAPDRLLALAVAAALLATPIAIGCGDDEGGTTSTVTTTETETTGAEPTTGTGSGSGGDGSTPPADIEVTELTGFSSPTGNIGCFIDRESVRCDIAERSWSPPDPPADCELDYGQGISLSAGGAADFVCAGDTALGAGEPLPYGQSIAAGLLRCESSEAGISCRDVESGRGFAIAREGYEIF